MSTISAMMFGQKMQSYQRNNLIALVTNVWNLKDHEGTWFFDLDWDNGKRWAIAIAWMDWDNTNDWRLYAKVAYQPKNSLMQCDYDIDWIMPYDEETGEVDDTETEITDIEKDVDWLLKEWERIRKEYVDNDEE